MIEINPIFPVFSKESLINSPAKISNALLEKGVCYITGYEDQLEQVSKEFDTLNLQPNGEVKVLAPTEAKVYYPFIYSILFAEEFKAIKRQILGWFYKDEIEIFCQHTGSNSTPPSGVLHFDKRYTFKSWYYLNDLDPNEGPMRVVPLDQCEEYSPIKMRKEKGTRNLFRGNKDQHLVTDEAINALESASEYVTGPKGTLFLHITEAWHGASPVAENTERKILRAHSRAFSDHFIK